MTELQDGWPFELDDRPIASNVRTELARSWRERQFISFSKDQWFLLLSGVPQVPTSRLYRLWIAEPFCLVDPVELSWYNSLGGLNMASSRISNNDWAVVGHFRRRQACSFRTPGLVGLARSGVLAAGRGAVYGVEVSISDFEASLQPLRIAVDLGAAQVC